MINSSRLIKNSISNIVNGFATSLMSVAITPFLYEILTKDEFSIWSVTIQLGILINVAATSLQVSVGRFVSYRLNSLSKSVNSMFRFQQLVFCLILLSTLFISLLSINYGWLIQNYQAITDTLPNASWSISIVCFSYMLNIFGGYFTGVFIGKEKNEIPALVNVVFKCILGVALVNVAHYGLLSMSLSFFIINIFSYLVLCYLSPSYIKFIFVRCAKKAINSFPELNNEEWRYYYGVFVLNFSTFLVSGIGVLLISKYDYGNVANFSISIGIVNLIVGAFSTMLSPLIQPLTIFHLNNESRKIDEIYIKMTVLLSLIVLFLLFFSNYFSLIFFEFWIDKASAPLISEIFNLSLLVYLVRIIGIPFGLVLLAKGLQNRLLYFPLLEGVINLVLGIILVNYLGWLGVACAVGISGVIILTMYVRLAKTLLSINVNFVMGYILYSFFPLSILIAFLWKTYA